MEKIKIENTPFSTTEFYAGVIELEDEDYDFSICHNFDENGHESIAIHWLDEEIPENVEVYEAEIREIFDSMFEVNGN